MEQQTLDNFLESLDKIQRIVEDKAKKAQPKQKGLNNKEQDSPITKDNTIQIIQEKQGGTSSIKGTIQSLNKIKEMLHNSRVMSIIELSNLRIVTGDGKGYLTLFKVDYEKEQWTKITEKKEHNDGINCLCELRGNRLVSSSNDWTLKVWNISNDSLTHIKTLEGHTGYVCMVISSTKDTIASASYDGTIKIWDINTYKETQTL